MRYSISCGREMRTQVNPDHIVHRGILAELECKAVWLKMWGLTTREIDDACVEDALHSAVDDLH